MKGAAFAKFDETVDVAVRLGVDPRHADQVVRGTVVLPARNRKVGSRARHHPGRQGAGGGSRRRRLRGHRVHPEDQGRLARVRRHRRHAGRHGPARPARPGARPARPDAEPEGGHGHDGRRPRRCGRSRRARSSSASTRPATCTRRSARCRSPPTQLADNVSAFMDTIVRAKPSAAKGVYVRSATISSTMGPGVRLDTAGYR